MFRTTNKTERRRLQKAKENRQFPREEEQMSAAIESALTALAAGAVTAAGAAALSSGGIAALLKVLDWDQFGVDLAKALQNPIAGAYFNQAFASVQDLAPATAAYDFEMLEPRAIAFAAKQAGVRVIQISGQIRDQIKTITLSGLEDGATRGERQRLIEQFIPLHDRFQTAVLNTRNLTFKNAIKAGSTLAEANAAADKAAALHAARLTKVRANAIARTEIQLASNAGRYEGWATEISLGHYSADSMKQWVVGGNPCDICAPCDGETVPWDGTFSCGIDMPPAHVNCECGAVILPPDTDAVGPSTDDGKPATINKAKAKQRVITMGEGEKIAADYLRVGRGGYTMQDHLDYLRTFTGWTAPADSSATTSNTQPGVLVGNSGRITL